MLLADVHAPGWQEQLQRTEHGLQDPDPNPNPDPNRNPDPNPNPDPDLNPDPNPNATSLLEFYDSYIGVTSPSTLVLLYPARVAPT